jgi:DNA mismatch repair protein MutL
VSTLSQNRIQVLPPAVAERIAAGEVIERPASVVKELVENSVDALATEIQVSLSDGGKNLIEVLDNGVGMDAPDLRLSVQRHATSKLKTLLDLEKILTLGFRGEALPSVAAVSELEILSRSKDSPLPSGTSHELRATAPGIPRSDDDVRKTTFGHYLNTPHGTRIRAQGLFSQVPARLKFLKSQASEVSQVREWIERIALAHPQIGFKLLSDGRTILNLRPEDEASRVGALLSDSDSHPLIQAESANAEFKVRMYWFQGLSLPSAKKLLQVINGRSVRDKVLQQAIMQPFRQALLPGQFPAVALFIDVNPELLDVNVHPTKTEVRFLNSRAVFHSVSRLIEASLLKHGAPAYASGGVSSSQAPIQDWKINSGVNSEPSQAQRLSLWTLAEKGADSSLDEGTQPFTTHPLTHSVYVGNLFGTYFVYDDKTEMVLVDQHAAHERIRYEKLKKRVIVNSGNSASQNFTSQILLVPEAVRFPAEARHQIEARMQLLTDLGFDAELFSEDTLLIRSIPSEWGANDPAIRLKNLISKLTELEGDPQPKTSREVLWDERLFEKLASEACHSAIRAGDRVDSYQASEIVKQLFECEHPWNCPHGRPTVVRIARGKLEEWFQRKV